MAPSQLKSNIHQIIDRIENEQLLQNLYDFLKGREHHQAGQLWETLSSEEKNQVLSAFEESEEEYHLIDREKVFPKKK